MLTTSFITEAKLYSTGISSILPDSILEKSSMSFMIDRSVLPALWMSSAYFLIGSPGDVRRIISSIPIIAFIGVLISWDIFARKSLFALFEAFAASFSSSSIFLSYVTFCSSSLISSSCFVYLCSFRWPR